MIGWLILGGAGAWIYRLFKDGKEIKFNVTEVALTDTQNKAINGWVKVVFENPPSTQFHIKDLDVKLYLQNAEIGRSVEGPAFTIPPKERDKDAQRITHKINFTIPLENLPGAINLIITSGKIGNVRFDTTFKANGLPVPVLSKTFEL